MNQVLAHIHPNAKLAEGVVVEAVCYHWRRCCHWRRDNIGPHATYFRVPVSKKL